LLSVINSKVAIAGMVATTETSRVICKVIITSVLVIAICSSYVLGLYELLDRIRSPHYTKLPESSVGHVFGSKITVLIEFYIVMIISPPQ
jgi:hypothetical protein